MSLPSESVIHDIGYRRYEGPRLGPRYIAGSLFVHGLRASYGLGRTAKAKIFPWTVAGIVLVVAVVLAAIKTQTGQALLSYPEFPEALTLLIILFCAIVAPELVSRDLRSGVLPLYFSRPLSRTHYALIKLAALVTAVFAMLAVPQTVMFAAAAFGADDLGAVWSEFGDFLPGVAYSLIHALVFGSIALLVSSLTGRRAVAAGATVAVFLVTTPVVGVLSILPSRDAQQLAGLASPATLVGGLGDWLFESTGTQGVGSYGPAYAVTAVALVALCVALLLARYRKVAS